MSNLFKFILLCSLFPSALFSQELKTVKHTNKRDGSVEVYTVLKTDKNVQHGAYLKRNDRGRKMITGFYTNGLRDSVWTIYNVYKGTVFATGKYQNDQPVGVWEYYSEKERLVQRYDRTTKRLLYSADSTWDKQKKHKLVIAGDTVVSNVGRPAIILGGDGVLQNYLQRTIRYPANARENGIQGTVVVTFFVDKDGRAGDFKIKRPVDGGCSEEALRVLKGLSNEWIPAEKNGEPVVMQVEMPVTFQLASY
jgi:TonB family protein